MAKNRRKQKKMLRKFNFDYDSENDSLFIYDPDTKSKGSVEMDDFIIDFNVKKDISGIELLNASVFLENLEIEERKMNIKEALKHIEECKVEIIQKDNFYVIKFVLLFDSKQKLATPLVIPTLKESSPALAGISA